MRKMSIIEQAERSWAKEMLKNYSTHRLIGFHNDIMIDRIDGDKIIYETQYDFNNVMREEGFTFLDVARMFTTDENKITDPYFTYDYHNNRVRTYTDADEIIDYWTIFNTLKIKIEVPNDKELEEFIKAEIAKGNENPMYCLGENKPTINAKKLLKQKNWLDDGCEFYMIENNSTEIYFEGNINGVVYDN